MSDNTDSGSGAKGEGLRGPEAAAAFAEWRGHFPIAVTTIVPDDNRTPTFYLSTVEELANFAAEECGKKGIYYSLAQVTTQTGKKPKKAELRGTFFVHADLDAPYGLTPAEVDRWIEQTLERIREKTAGWPPSAIIRSGNGLHLIWRLDTFFDFGDGAERQRRIDEIESRTRGICVALGGDRGTHNVDRILRLPGTDNAPNKRKRERGRVRRQTSIVYLSDTTYSLDDFPQDWGDGADDRRVAEPVDIDRGEPIRLNDLSELDEYDLPPWVAGTIEQGDHPTEPGKWEGDRSRAVFAVTGTLLRAGVPPALVAGILIDETWRISDHQRDHEMDTVRYAWEQVDNALKKGATAADTTSDGRRILDPKDPFRTGKRLLSELYPDTIRWNDDFLSYRDGAYRDVEDDGVKAELWRELDKAMVWVKKDNQQVLARFKPNRNNVLETLAALKAIAHIPADNLSPPCWLADGGPDPLSILPCRNGLLDVRTGELVPASADFFTRNAVDVEFDPAAPEPEIFLRFIEDVMPDPLARELLREWMAYLLTPDVSQQKILLMVGPARAGKGVTQRIIRELVGVGNTCNPLSSDMGGTNVGALEVLIGKSVAFMSDARFSRTANSHAVTERLLTISGGDPITISRKYKDAWNGQLPTRFVMLTNELPQLKDNSPALANRFVPLLFEKSFLGREDPTLAARIIASELPGILNWALEGRRQLDRRGRFKLPQASEDAIAEIMDLGSPVAAFVRQYCDEGPGKQIKKEVLFDKWKQHCKENEVPWGKPEEFARDLYAATNHRVKSVRLAADSSGRRPYVFDGIDLSGAANDPY